MALVRRFLCQFLVRELLSSIHLKPFGLIEKILLYLFNKFINLCFSFYYLLLKLISIKNVQIEH